MRVCLNIGSNGDVDITDAKTGKEVCFFPNCGSASKLSEKEITEIIDRAKFIAHALNYHPPAEHRQHGGRGMNTEELKELLANEIRIDELRLKAFITNDPDDRAKYFDAVSRWFQRRDGRRLDALGLAAEVIALQAEVERMREALTPFAEACQLDDPDRYDDADNPRWAEFFEIGDFRRARAALETKENE